MRASPQPIRRAWRDTAPPSTFFPAATRAPSSHPPFPLTFVGGSGCRVTDLDGHEHIDLVSEYTAGLYGHSNPVIAAAQKEIIDGGLSLGAPNIVEAEYARALVDRFPGFERVRFCNSGTEANIMAISAARAITGRSKVIAMHEGYHGGVLTFAHGGSPLNLPFPFIFAEYNDVDDIRALVAEHGADLAAVILEPMMGGGGCIPATKEFLEAIRAETLSGGALMIMDEVVDVAARFSRPSRPPRHPAGPADHGQISAAARASAVSAAAPISWIASILRRRTSSHGGTFNRQQPAQHGRRHRRVHVGVDRGSQRQAECTR